MPLWPYAVSLLKEVCRACWDEVDAECLGWLEVSEARAVLDRVLLVLAARTAQIAAMIAPPNLVDSNATAVAAAVASNDAAASPSAASSSSSAAAASASAASILASSASLLPASPDTESEVRASLARLFPSLRRNLPREFKFLLEHIEARPAAGKVLKGFTPPANQTSPAGAAALSAAAARKLSTASNGSQGSGSVGSGTTVHSQHSQSNGHASAAAVSAMSPSPVAAASDSAAAAAAAAPSSSSLLSGRSSSSDRRIFRCEFNTAVVLWLEAQMMQAMMEAGTPSDSGNNESRDGAG